MASTSPTFTWSWLRFEHLSVDDVYDLLALRSEIFVVEQDCVFLDPDGSDRQAWHLLGRVNDETSPRPWLGAYLRCLDAGVHYPEPSIGRVVVSGKLRGLGGGRVLMDEGLARVRMAWPSEDIVINAQRRLEAFYASLGFRTEGLPYDEDGIDHVAMRLAGARS
jgi:ElaA protein